MAMGSSTKWRRDGSCVVVEFQMELTDGKRCWAHIGVQQGERVVW